MGWNKLIVSGSRASLFDVTSSNGILVSGSIRTPNYIDFFIATGSSVPSQLEGRVYYDKDEQALTVFNGITDTSLQVGQESVVLVRNTSGATINNGNLLMVTGTIGNSGRLTVANAVLDGSVSPYLILGVATNTILNGADGLVTSYGKVKGINTTGTPASEDWNDGDIIYANSLSPSGLSKFIPDSPNLKIEVGVVIHSATNGILFVDVDRKHKLSDLYNVTTTTPTSGDLLVLNGSNVWVNTKTLGGTYSINNLTVTGNLIATASYSLFSVSSSNSTNSLNSITSSYSLTSTTSSYSLNSNQSNTSSFAVLAHQSNTSSLSIRSLTSSIAIKDENITVVNEVSSLNFAGTGVSVSNSGTSVTVTINGTGGGGVSTGNNVTGSFSNSNSWVFNHDLNYRLVSIQTYDTNYRQIIPSNIELTTDTQAIITFPTNESGYAIASLGGVPITRATNIQRISGSSYTVQPDDYRIGVKYTLTGSFDLTLPLISSVNEVEYRIKDEEGNASVNYINIYPSGIDTIENDSIFVINSNYGAIGLYNDGISKWFIE